MSGEVNQLPSSPPRILLLGARSGKNLIKGSPINVKRWKKRFFFVSGDDWEFFPNLARGEGVLWIPRTWGTPGARQLELKFELKLGSYVRIMAPLRAQIERDIKKTQLKETHPKGGGVKGRKHVIEVDPRCKGGFYSGKTFEGRGFECFTQRGKVKKERGPTPVGGEQGKNLGDIKHSLGSATVAEKILSGTVLPTDKEKADKLSLDQMVSKFFHIVELAELEMVRAQNQTIELEGIVAEFVEWEKKANDKLKAKSDALARLEEEEVAELKKNKVLAKEKTVEEYKSSEDFQEAMESAASKYFGEGFDFCKRQLAHHHPNLGIDLDDMGLDYDLLKEEEDDAEDEGGKEEGNKEKGEGKGRH
ncbi:hypothetical protein Acr_10g0010130 [Actinidia rufa]|uniref:Uncharacterized protein n=1 Tax=Actinidia rufa TaxID=165716 RepID=A0A7J0FAA0_9ERIC|nr:hypothetical protein Acr_10g0010130 [Actinidia rufa]